MISLTLMISRSSLFVFALQNSLSPLYITSMCRDHSTTVNYQGSHLVVRVRAVAHLVLEAVTDPLLLEIILIHLTVLITMTVTAISSQCRTSG